MPDLICLATSKQERLGSKVVGERKISQSRIYLKFFGRPGGLKSLSRFNIGRFRSQRTFSLKSSLNFCRGFFRLIPIAIKLASRQFLKKTL
jgi:hypothetical protein